MKKLKIITLITVSAIVATSAIAQIRSQCMGTTNAGNRCQNLAKAGSYYCHLHGGYLNHSDDKCNKDK
jgi:hypothetical protein